MLSNPHQLTFHWLITHKKFGKINNISESDVKQAGSSSILSKFKNIKKIKFTHGKKRKLTEDGVF